MATDPTLEILVKIAEKAGIDPSRLTISPVMQDPVTFAFHRILYLDGRRVNVQWASDYTLDTETLQTRHLTKDEIVASLAEQLKYLL